MVLSKSKVSVDVQLDIVYRYKEGERVQDIKRTTGVTSIYSILRSEGIEPSRQRYGRRNSPRRRAAHISFLEALRAAAKDKGPATTYLTQAEYTAWRDRQDPPLPAGGLDAARFFGSWLKAVNEADLHADNESGKTEADEVRDWLKQAAASLNQDHLSKSDYDSWTETEMPTAWSSRRITYKLGWTYTLKQVGLQPRRRSQPTRAQRLPDAGAGH